LIAFSISLQPGLSLFADGKSVGIAGSPVPPSMGKGGAFGMSTPSLQRAVSDPYSSNSGGGGNNEDISASPRNSSQKKGFFSNWGGKKAGSTRSFQESSRMLFILTLF
jgi:hypothetical protein